MEAVVLGQDPRVVVQEVEVVEAEAPATLLFSLKITTTLWCCNPKISGLWSSMHRGVVTVKHLSQNMSKLLRHSKAKSN